MWAIVLGGSSGLGLASSKRLALDGYKLCVVYREPRVNQGKVTQAMTELEAHARAVLHFNVDALADAGRTQVLDTLEKALREGERVHVLLHSLAKGALKPLHTGPTPAKSWPAPFGFPPLQDGLSEAGDAPSEAAPSQALIAYHQAYVSTTGFPASGPHLTSVDVKLTVDAMATSLLDWVTDLRARQLFASDTRVLAFTSEGSHRVWPGYAAVSAAKAALEALVRSMAYELGPLGIRANCIQAGITDTAALRHIPHNELLKLQAVARNPLGRLTTPEDVASVVGLLCKPDAAWINGTVVVVDGGEHLC